MQRIADTNIFVGSILDYAGVKNNWAVVHATQTLHYKLFGWSRSNPPDKTHGEYLKAERKNHLFLNWVDGAARLYEWWPAESFTEILDFIDRFKDRNILIHCENGMSRSPTLALIYCAKRLGIISNMSFGRAKEDFLKLYPKYSPNGIAEHVEQIWNRIL